MERGPSGEVNTAKGKILLFPSGSILETEQAKILPEITVPEKP
jgi:hypothetical protein